ncbi:MAG: response regulator [Pseudomonadota bacterium]
MPGIAFQKLSFLVVDDNAHMRRIIRTLLHGFGTREVYEAEDGAEGLESVEAFSPDIVITDWVMPIFDGAELVRMIRNPDGGPHAFTPIIMLTAYSEKKRVMEARDLGVNEFLCKPIAAKSLYQRIFSIVHHPRPFIRTKTYLGPGRRREVNPRYAGPERRNGGKAEVMAPEPIVSQTPESAEQEFL